MERLFRNDITPQGLATQYLQASLQSEPSQKAYQDRQGCGWRESGLSRLQERPEIGVAAASGVLSVLREFPPVRCLVEM